ncbi:MAG: CHAD domain-containing protein [Armatimonadetes bacterium]|nr:CHAD domain-containing protein [Armatimonadota bacterium]
MGSNDPVSNKLAGDPDSPLGQEIARRAKSHLKKIRKLSVGACLGDVDAVHDMRVEVRRLRALIRLKRDFLKRKGLKPLAAFAKDLGCKLGAVRAEDVLIMRLRELCPSDALRILEIGVALRRSVCAKQLCSLLESGGFNAWLKGVENHLCCEDGPNEHVRDFADRALKRAFEPLGARSGMDGLATLQEMHSLRIHAKKFRYVLEFFARSTSWDASSTLAKLPDLQDYLGELHDEDVLLQELHGAQKLAVEWRAKEVEELKEAATNVQRSIDQQRKAAPEHWAFLFKDLPAVLR